MKREKELKKRPIEEEDEDCNEEREEWEGKPKEIKGKRRVGTGGV